jgi:pyroglutamyl-peptidase
MAAHARATRTVLVTGFEPFGGQTVNPSELAARAIDGRIIAGRHVHGVVLPCLFGEAEAGLARALRARRPELVICTGEAGGRREITIERVAINVDDARIPDNAGRQPIDRPIAPRGPVGYWSTLPIKAIVAALTGEGIPAAVSQTAGTFVCNHLFYSLMRSLARRRGVRGGFVHLPFLPEQVAKGRTRRERAPSMPLDRIVAALHTVIATSLATKRDLRRGGGATH